MRMPRVREYIKSSETTILELSTGKVRDEASKNERPHFVNFNFQEEKTEDRPMVTRMSIKILRT
jgi:hypothetical protein